MNKKTVYISLSLLGIVVFFEYMIEKDTRKKLKSRINNIGKKNVNAFSENNSEKLKKELLKVNSCEKIHLLYSFQNTFKQESPIIAVAATDNPNKVIVTLLNGRVAL